MDFVDPASLAQRHCLEDSDEEDESLTTPSTGAGSFIIPEDTAKLPPGSYLILTIGQAASIFAQSYLSLTPLPSCTISTECQTMFKDKYFSKSSTAQCVVSEGFTAQSKESAEQFYLCTHKRELNSQHCNLWCEKVMEMFQPKLVLILTSRRGHEYFSQYPRESDSASSHTLRALHSGKWSPLDPVAVSLESPNTIIGEAAAALTHCQLRGLPAALLVCYSDSSQSTAECVAAFRPVLRHSLVQDLVIKSRQEAAVRMKKLVPKPRQDLSGLYT